MKIENKSAIRIPKKNMLQDIESMSTSSLWLQELGITVVKTGEKFQGADIHRLTFQPDSNGRVFQLFNERGIFSASLWVKFIQYDTSLVLTLRERNFGTAFGLTSINNAIYDWQQVKLENANVTKECMFAIYKSGRTQTQEVIVDVAMPQLEKGSVVTDFEPYQLVNKQSSLIPKKNLLPAIGATNINITEQEPYSFLIDAPSGGYTYTPFSLIEVKPNTQYTLSYNKELFLNDVGVTVSTAEGATITNLSGNLPYTFGTGNNKAIQLRFWRVLATGSKVRISNFQLEEGAVATPFEPYVLSNKKASLVPEKNLIPPFTDSRWSLLSSPTTVIVNDYEITTNAITGVNAVNVYVKPNTQYTFSAENPNSSIYFIDSYTTGDGNAKRYTAPAGNTNDSLTFTTNSQAGYVRVILRNSGVGGKQDTWKNLQLEEGSLTSYAPYKEVSKTSKQYASGAKKNLIHTSAYGWELGTLTSGVNTDSTRRLRLKSNISARQNVLYTLTFDNTYDMSISSYDSNNTWLRESTWASSPISFTTSDASMLRMIIRRKDGEVMSLSELDTIKPQFEEGIATKFESFQVVKKKSSSYVPKAPYKNYPFTFQRESVEDLNGIRYGYNIPRIKDNGLLIEEGTVNLVPPVEQWTANWIPANPAKHIDDYVRLTLDVSKGTVAAIRHSKFFSATAGKSYTISFKARAGRDGLSLNYTYYMGGGYGGGNKALATEGYRPALTTDWKEYKYTTTFDSTTSSGHILMGFYNSNDNVDGDWMDFKDVQVEERNFATSLAVGERKAEYVYVPDADKFIDATQGSIEYTVKPIIDSTVYPASGFWGWNDLVYYDDISNGFLIRRNNEAVGGHSIWIQGTEKTYDLAYKAGDEIKYKFEWDADGSRLYANDVVVASTGVKFVAPSAATAKRLYIGCRSTSSRKQGNASYKDILIKDGNGNITWQL